MKKSQFDAWAAAELDEFDLPQAGWTDGVVDACGGVVETFGFDV